ncbi:MAG: hypothetical protein LBL82_04465 [Oscillospiraceae bacterium]|jgi:hypothetical protein|nr:hypothetical protein [Oscillospiraceae bacterium]
MSDSLNLFYILVEAVFSFVIIFVVSKIVAKIKIAGEQFRVVILSALVIYHSSKITGECAWHYGAIFGGWIGALMLCLVAALVILTTYLSGSRRCISLWGIGYVISVSMGSSYSLSVHPLLTAFLSSGEQFMTAAGTQPAGTGVARGAGVGKSAVSFRYSLLIILIKAAVSAAAVFSGEFYSDIPIAFMAAASAGVIYCSLLEISRMENIKIKYISAGLLLGIFISSVM